MTRTCLTAVVSLMTMVRAFMASYHRTMAKPFTWTHQGKALVA